MPSRSLFHLLLSIPTLVGIGILLILFVRSGSSELSDDPTPKLAAEAWSGIFSAMPADMPATYPEVDEELPESADELSPEQKLAYPRSNAFLLSCSLLVVLGVFGMNAMGISLSSREPSWHGFLRTGTLCAVTLGSMILFGFNLAFPFNEAGVVPLPSFSLPGTTDSLEYGLSGITEWTDLFFMGTYSLFMAALFLSLGHGPLRSAPLFLIAIPVSTLIFPIVVSWKWGAGWLDSLLNNIDFAGAALLHWHAGVAILVIGLIATIVARSKGLQGTTRNDSMSPKWLAIYLIGGFAYLLALIAINTGSALDSAPELVAPVLQATLLGGGVSGILGLVWAALSPSKPFVRYLIVGIAGGIVATSGATDSLSSQEAIVFGIVAGVLVPGAAFLLERVGWIDPLSIGAIHGIGGFIGVLGSAFAAGEEFTLIGQITMLITVPILALLGALLVSLIAAGIGHLFLPSETDKAPPSVPAR